MVIFPVLLAACIFATLGIWSHVAKLDPAPARRDREHRRRVGRNRVELRTVEPNRRRS